MSKNSLYCIALCFLLSLSGNCLASKGWHLYDAENVKFEAGIDSTIAHKGKKSGFITNTGASDEKSGYYMQRFNPTDYLGKRIEVIAYIKSERELAKTYLWTNISAQTRSGANYANSKEQTFKNKTEWNQHRLVLDVDNKATKLTMGFAHKGYGTSWIDSVSISIVDSNTPLTSSNMQKERNEYLEIIGINRAALSETLNDMNFSENSFKTGGAWWSSQYVNEKFVVKTDIVEKRLAGYMGARETVTDDLGVFLQTIKASMLLDKKIRVTAKVKSNGINDWAGIWLRSDDINGNNLSFHNMQKTPIKGTLDWHEVSFEIDIPAKSHVINFGTVMRGQGQLWVDEISISSIGKADMVKDKKNKKIETLSQKLINLDFE